MHMAVFILRLSLGDIWIVQKKTRYILIVASVVESK